MSRTYRDRYWEDPEDNNSGRDWADRFRGQGTKMDPMHYRYRARRRVDAELRRILKDPERWYDSDLTDTLEKRVMPFDW